MPKIKTRETHREIKALDKAAAAGERMKSVYLRSRSTAAGLLDNGQETPEEYAGERFRYAAEDTAHRAVHVTLAQSKKLAQKGQSIIRARLEKAAAASRHRAVQRTAKAVTAAARVIRAGGGKLAAIASAAYVVFVAVIVFCLVGMLAGSPFGILFTGGNTNKAAVSAAEAVALVLQDVHTKLAELQDGDYDVINYSGELAEWPEVLAVYAVKVAGRQDVDALDVATLDKKRLEKLKKVFWEMNVLDAEAEIVEYPDSNPEDDVDDSWAVSILHISFTPRTAGEMKTQYRFSDKQKETLEELLESRDLLTELTRDLRHYSTEAADLLRSLPADLAPERRTVIEAACSLVGKVTYFWGGKSLVLGWDSRWGSIQRVWADGSATTGMYLPYGLDCSGFVDWAFYNATNGAYIIGHGGGAAMQHTHCTPIAWDEARPGDLVFYPNDDHVGIIGGRDEAGNLLIIHCAAASNGVTITGAAGFISAARPRYYPD